MGRAGRETCYIFTVPFSEKASHVDPFSLKYVFPSVERHGLGIIALSLFILAQKKIRTKWKVRSGIVLKRVVVVF